MERSPHPRRRLRRIRTILALLAAGTAVSIAAACRLESSARAVAALATVGCLIAWAGLLELEGRIAERLERRPAAGRRAAGVPRTAPRRRRPTGSRRVA